MRRRWHRRDVDPATPRPVELLELSVEADWRLQLTWQGPDARAGAVGGGYPNPHLAFSDTREVTDASAVLLRFDENGDPCDADGVALRLPADGTLPLATTAPLLPDWVERRRRVPTVLASEARPWGREAGAATVPALVVEWLPLVERVRGGDGRVELGGLRLGRESRAPEAVHGGRVPGRAPASVENPAADLPPARLPRFRVTGTNPTAAQIEQLVTRLVRLRLPAVRAQPHVGVLNDACWITTIRMIVAWESHDRGQFDGHDPGRFAFGGFFTSHERDMPTFGAPHGYGLGQLDNWGPRPVVGVDAEMVWSFVANVEQMIALIFTEKAPAAWALINGHPPRAPASAADRARFRAVFQREVVRRYNGGREFRWSGADWEIDPTPTLAAVNVPYPNQVMGTGVNYAARRPIPFTAADFGPDSGLVP